VALLGALISELVLFLGASWGLMALALRRRPEGGLFSAMWPGALPALVLAGLTFYQWQQAGDPGLKAAHQSLMEPLQQAAKDRFGKPEQAEQRQQMVDLGESLFTVAPALEAIFRLALLAPLAVLLRRRKARAGLSPDPGPLSRWSAPWWLAWAVLGPLFWLLARRESLAQGPDWADPLAWNILVLGAAVQAFHGSVVLFGKLAAWSSQPRTRALVPLSLGLAFASVLLLADLRPLLAMTALLGLFDPWLDLRRLRQPPVGEPLDKGGEA
jgi:hypothetical protein